MKYKKLVISAVFVLIIFSLFSYVSRKEEVICALPGCSQYIAVVQLDELDDYESNTSSFIYYFEYTPVYEIKNLLGKPDLAVIGTVCTLFCEFFSDYSAKTDYQSGDIGLLLMTYWDKDEEWHSTRFTILEGYDINVSFDDQIELYRDYFAEMIYYSEGELYFDPRLKSTFSFRNIYTFSISSIEIDDELITKFDDVVNEIIDYQITFLRENEGYIYSFDANERWEVFPDPHCINILYTLHYTIYPMSAYDYASDISVDTYLLYDSSSELYYLRATFNSSHEFIYRLNNIEFIDFYQYLLEQY